MPQGVGAAPWHRQTRLLVSVLFAVPLRRLCTMMDSMMAVTMCHLGVMGGLFVMPGRMMLGRFMVVPCGVLMMLCRFAVMLRCFLGHDSFLHSLKRELDQWRLSMTCI
jgi:hypothetical protein